MLNMTLILLYMRWAPLLRRAGRAAARGRRRHAKAAGQDTARGSGEPSLDQQPQPAKGAERSAPVAAPLPRQSEKRTMDRPAPQIQRTTLTRGAPGVGPLRSACIEPLHHACMLAGQ